MTLGSDAEKTQAFKDFLAARLNGVPQEEPSQPTVASVSSDFRQITKAWLVPKPGPRTWLVHGMIPDKWPGLTFGDGGVGKSTLLTHLGLHICTGAEWFGHLVEQRNVLFVDAELDEEEFVRRLYALSVGMGLGEPPEGIYYWRMPKALSHAGLQEHLLAEVRANDIGFVIVDSLTIATHLSDQNYSSDLLTVIFALQQWGIPFQFIDHHAKSGRGADPDQVSVYGTAFKHNAVRSEIYIQGGVHGSMMLHPKKHNFSAKWEPIAIAVEFSGEESIRYRKLAVNDPRAVALRSRGDRAATIDAVRDLAEGTDAGVPTKTIASYMQIGEDAARKRLERLLAEGRVQRSGRGLWTIYPDPEESGQ